MNTRLLAAILAAVLIAPEAAPAKAIPAHSLLTALAAPLTPPQQCRPPACPIRVADDDTVVVPDVCDAVAQTQCANDCQLQRSDCETGHDDSLPCEANYTTCASNCAVVAGCSN